MLRNLVWHWVCVKDMLYPAPEICIMLIFQTIQKNCVKLCKWLIISIGFQTVLCLTTLQRENRWTCLRFLFMSTTQSMMVLSPIGECVCVNACVYVVVCVFLCECVCVLLLHHCCSFLSLYFSSLTLLLSGRHGVCVFHSSDHGNNQLSESTSWNIVRDLSFVNTGVWAVNHVTWQFLASTKH